MNALDFLDFVLDKHHDGINPSEDIYNDYTGENEGTEPTTDGCELVSAIDK